MNAPKYTWKPRVDNSVLPSTCAGADRGKMAMSKASTGDIILQGGRKVDLRDRSLSSLDVASLAKLISTSTIVEALSLYNVRLSSDVSATRTTALDKLRAESRQSLHCRIAVAAIYSAAWYKPARGCAVRCQVRSGMRTIQLLSPYLHFENVSETTSIRLVLKIRNLHSFFFVVPLAHFFRQLQDAVFLARSLEFNDTLATLNFTHNPIGEVSRRVRHEILLLCVSVSKRQSQQFRSCPRNP